LKKGPNQTLDIQFLIPRDDSVEEIRKLIEPSEEKRPYPLIIGEHGTGKTSLIRMAISRMSKARDIIYLDLPPKCRSDRA
jgi:polynucleotide 5'-kinase involved in rRNA processing